MQGPIVSWWPTHRHFTNAGNGNPEDSIDEVSSELLIRILGSLGYRVTVSVRRAAKVA
jgi:hypothetical protein